MIDTEPHADRASAGHRATRISAPPSRHRGPASTAHGQQSRDRVLTAAASLITEMGIERVRLAEIARRAGMSSGQVMHYFTSKEHILLETLAWQEDKDSRHRRATLPTVTGAWQRLERYADLYLPASPADPAWILWTEAWARAPHSPDVSEFLNELWLPWGEDLAAIVHDGIQDGTFRQVSPSDFTTCFCALLDGLAILHLHQRPDLPRKHLIELAMDNARAQLTPAPPRGPGQPPAPAP
jgi:AcrR family transcriptional regulator